MITTTSEVIYNLPVSDIDIGHRRRTLNPDRVKVLADSMKAIGLQTPISVKNDGVRTHLVAGLHRIEAAKLLGWHTIKAIRVEFTGVDLKRWEIAENLHRAELTALERDQHIAEWIALTNEIDKLAQVGPVSPATGGRGNTGGVRAAARELGIEKEDARRAVKVASLTDDAKQLARELGLDKKRGALLRAASNTDPKEQIRSLKRSKEEHLRRYDKAYRYVNSVVWGIDGIAGSLKRMEEHGIDVNEIGANYAKDWAEMLTEAIEALPLITKLRDQLLEVAKDGRTKRARTGARFQKAAGKAAA